MFFSPEVYHTHEWELREQMEQMAVSVRALGITEANLVRLSKVTEPTPKWHTEGYLVNVSQLWVLSSLSKVRPCLSAYRK